MGSFRDLTGQKFGRLTVLYRGDNLIGKSGRTRVRWMCECDCENHTHILVLENSLTSGHTRSCGCLTIESLRERMTTHGDSCSKLYQVWTQILDRCENTKNKRYLDYGGRSITVCEEWHQYVAFKNWAVQNGYKEGLSIDRINNDYGYCPSNCRWATNVEQSNNMRRKHMVGNYKVITLCGSTRFKDAFIEAQKKLTLEGNIVISVGLFGHSGDSEVWTEGAKEMLDDMHKRKIDMADEIFVINVGGYIGSSTRSEIEYAHATGKPVRYLER